MKWYVATDKVDWADEFDLPFGELIDEPTYKKYKYISDALKSVVRINCLFFKSTLVLQPLRIVCFPNIVSVFRGLPVPFPNTM